MQKICSILVVGALVICGVVRMNSQESEHEVNLKIVSLIEERFWLQSQRAEKKIPPEHKEDFRALLRVVLTDTEDGEKTRTAFEEFRKKVFPNASDVDAYGWVYALDGEDEIAVGYKVMLTEMQKEGQQRR